MTKRETPSMDDKEVASPPVKTTAEYEADKEAGINRIGLKVIENSKIK